MSDPRVDISFGYKLNQTLLHVIVKKQWRMIDGLSDLLLKNGVNVNAKDSNGDTPLDIVKKDPFSGLTPCQAIERGEALIKAVKNGDHERLGQLIQEEDTLWGIVTSTVRAYYTMPYIKINRIKSL